MRKSFATIAVVITVVLMRGGSISADEVRPAGLPPEIVRVSPCIPTMGEHWADPKTLPEGPYYGVYDGQIVFTEIMLDQADFAAGKSWQDTLKPIAGHAIDHVDITFEPHGHHGYPIPHYDVHAYYVPHETHMAFCPKT